MRTNVEIDDKLLAELMELTGANQEGSDRGRSAHAVAVGEIGQSNSRGLWQGQMEGDLDVMRRADEVGLIYERSPRQRG